MLIPTRGRYMSIGVGLLSYPWMGTPRPECRVGQRYNPHTFSFIHNQPKAPTEDEGQEIMFMKHLCAMLLALIAATASAQTFVVDGIHYRVLSEDDRTVEVTESPYGYSGEIVIPAEVTYDGSTYSVTTIGDEAFYWYNDLKSISMPSVTTIGEYAFYNCYYMTSVYMPSVMTIGDHAFLYCHALTSVEMPAVTTIGDYAFYGCALTSVSMPEVTTIGDKAFSNCSALTSIEIPKATTIDDFAFDYCPALTSVEMPSVTTIGYAAFNYCPALASVSMPSVTTIGDYAFSDCESLISVEMPEVTTIGDDAFRYCYSLASVSIPATCTFIGENPFRGCTALKDIAVDGNNPKYSALDGALYDKDKTALIGWPTAKGDISILPTVTTIGGETFYMCDALTSVYMPSVTTIGDYTFSDCESLISVEMPQVTTIGDDAFQYCYSLASVSIPATCTFIGENPFRGCTALKDIAVDGNNPKYSALDGALYDKDKTALIGWPTAKGDISILPTVTTIGGETFYMCDALTSVYMPSVTTIGDYAFTYCSALTSVEMPQVTTIGERVFYGLVSLTSVSMPAAITIGDLAFNYCSALTSVDIPASVTTIGDFAFGSCSSLTSVYCHWGEPLECEPEFTSEVLKTATLYVPKGTVDDYRSVDPWKWFINIEEGNYSGISDTQQAGLSIAVVNGAIVVSGCDTAASAPVVEVYSAGGACVYRGTDSSIGGLGHGVYVVKVGGTVQKVAL